LYRAEQNLNQEGAVRKFEDYRRLPTSRWACTI